MLTSCVSYPPLPLNSKTEEASLRPPNLKDIEIKVSKIEHPLLKPIQFNLKDGISPDEAAILAVILNPELKAVRDTKEIARAQVLQAGLLPNPQISLGYEIPTEGKSTDTVNAYSGQINWEITALFTRGARRAAARAEKAAIDLTVAWEEWQVAEAAKLHTLRLLWAENKVALLNKAKGVVEKNLSLVEEAVALGEKTATDLSALHADYQQIRLELEAAREEREQERLRLNTILGLPPDTRLKIQRNISLLSWPPPLEKEKLFFGLTERRFDLLALKMTYRAQDERLRAAVLSQFPKIGLGILKNRDTDGIPTVGFSLSIDLPIFDQGKAHIALENAKRKRLYDEYLARLFSTRAEVTNIFEKIEFVRRKIALIQKNIAQLKQLLAAYEKALGQGNADIISYYQVQKELLSQRLELLKLGKTLSDLGVALEIATGLYFPLEGAR